MEFRSSGNTNNQNELLSTRDLEIDEGCSLIRINGASVIKTLYGTVEVVQNYRYHKIKLNLIVQTNSIDTSN